MVLTRIREAIVWSDDHRVNRTLADRRRPEKMMPRRFPSAKISTRMKTSCPNILFFFTDMQRFDTIGALNNPVICTPHLDRLVREGVAFEQAFSPNPVCIPARCSMHYGLYPPRTRVYENRSMMDDNGASLPALLGAVGYRTHAVGKCHFTPDHRALRGFQTRRIQEECVSDPAQDDYVAWLRDCGFDYYEPHGARGEMYYTPQVSTLPVEAHPTQWVGDETLRFLREEGASERPWFLFSSFIHPHPPFAPPKPWHKLYRIPDIPLPFLPEHRAELLTWINRFQNRYKYRDRGLDLQFLRLIRAYYYATISFIDAQIGRVLSALEEMRLLDDTLVIFSSDHGELLGDYGCFGKRSMHDPSARVPLLIRYPARFPTGARCDTAVSLVDVMPTLLAAAGAPTPSYPLDGVDLVEVVAGRQSKDRSVYSQYESGPKGLYMAVNRRWKYVFSAGDEREWFFDRQNDPREATDLSGATGAVIRAARDAMRSNLLAFLARAGESAAVDTVGGDLRWHLYGKLDESYLSDPDAHLLVQDYPPPDAAELNRLPDSARRYNWLVARLPSPLRQAEGITRGR